MIKPIHHPDLSKVKEAIEPEFLNTVATRAGIPFPSLRSPTLCFIVDIVRWKLGEGQSSPSLPALWPWVPDRYKSVRAGQHSSEQVNRASSNPSGGPQSAGAQQRLLQMLTFANTNSLAFWKTKLAISKWVLQMAALLLSRRTFTTLW